MCELLINLSAEGTQYSERLPMLPCRAAEGKVREDGQHRSLRFLLPCLRLPAPAQAKQEPLAMSSSRERTRSVVIAATLCRALWGAWD